MADEPTQVERRIAPDPAQDPLADSPRAPLPAGSRRHMRRMGDRIGPFVSGLKSNAGWMKKFLHGGK